MKAYVTYQEIEKGERKRLVAEVSRQPWSRGILFLSIFIPLLVSGTIADSLSPAKRPSFEYFGIRFASAVILAALFWESFGRRRLKQEVEKIKNA
jgi:hypothetical protein